MDPFVLLRHAKPLQEGSRAPAEWNLDPEHSGALAGLAVVLKDVGLDRIVTSSERKAVQTGLALARLVGLTTDADSRLDEVHRPFVGDDRAFAENVKSYLNGGTVVGWERQETAILRMRGAVEDARATGFVGLVTHGTAMSLFLADLGLVPAWEFWEELTAPDCWLIDGSGLRRLGVQRRVTVRHRRSKGLGLHPTGANGPRERRAPAQL